MSRFFGSGILQIGNFLAQFHYYVVAYVMSSFLAQFVGVQYVGYVFVASSVLVALILYAAPPFFRAFGTRNVLTVLGLAELTTLLGLAMTTATIPAIILVTIQSALTYAIFIGIDLLIEASTKSESVTGTTRTAYLIVSNVAVLLGALSLSFVVVGDQYYRAFITSALILLPFIMLSLWYFPRILYTEAPTEEGAAGIAFMKSGNLRKIALAHFVLQIFFSWMAIYSPILLFAYEGFTWAEIGVLLAIAMTPYIILEYPLGLIADHWLGEKEILIIGFAVIAISMFAVPLVAGASFTVWCALMVLSRVGAAMVESMTEVHFFRHVTERDTSTITAFRALRPLGNIVGPLIASAALLVLPLPSAFVLFGIVVLLGIPTVWHLVDSK